MTGRKTTWGLLRRFMAGGGMLTAVSMLLYTITIGMNLFPPLFQQVFTDYIITGKNLEWFWPLMFLYVALFVLELLAWLILNGHRRNLDMRFSMISQARYIWHALRLPMEAHTRYSAGDLIARFSGIGSTGVKLFDMAPTLVLMLHVVIFSYLLFVYHWKLGLIEIAALFTIALSIRLTMDYQKRKAHQMEAAMLLCLGAWFILKGELTPGMLLASQGFMSVMLYPITRMGDMMQDIFKAPES